MATHTSPQGTVTTVPAYGDIADGPAAFAAFANSLDLFLPPVGAVMPYAGTVALPTGSPWLLCNGGAIPTDAKYAALRSLVGNNLPDLRGKFLVGVNASDSDFSTVLKPGGSKTVSVQGTITKNNLPQHTHAATVTVTADTSKHSHGEDSETVDNTATAHTHANMSRVANNFTRSGTGSGLVPETSVSQSDRTSSAGLTAFTHSHKIHEASTGHNHAVTVTNAQDGGVVSPAALTMTGSLTPPYYTVNYIIRAF